MTHDDEAVERHERMKAERLSQAINRVNEAKDLNAARGDGVMTTSGDASVDDMIGNADIDASPDLGQPDQKQEEIVESSYADIVDEASEAFEYLAEGDFVDAKVETFMMYDDASGLYEVTQALTSDEDMLATAGQVFEWTEEMDKEYDLLDSVDDGGIEYTEKGQQVYNFLDSQA